jgi:hypothetical protein
MALTLIAEINADHHRILGRRIRHSLRGHTALGRPASADLVELLSEAPELPLANVVAAKTIRLGQIS